jgi:hypothetical protein
MKDFDIAKYLREHQLGSYGILNHYVDLKPLKEEEIAEGIITVQDTGVVSDLGNIHMRILKWMSNNFGPAKGQYDVQKRGKNIIINTGKLSKSDIADLNNFLDTYIRPGEFDSVDEDVTPEEIAEIPYEGPEPKLDGLGDEFEQAEIVSEDEEDFNPVYTRIDWEDLDDTDLNGASMEMAINDLIDDANADIRNAMMSDPTLARLAQANPTQAEAQIRLLIKKLWMNKIQNWRARN